MDPVELLKEKLLIACKIFQSQKLFDGFGHVTVRAAEDRILSTPKMPPGKVSISKPWRRVLELLMWPDLWSGSSCSNNSERRSKRSSGSNRSSRSNNADARSKRSNCSSRSKRSMPSDGSFFKVPCSGKDKLGRHFQVSATPETSKCLKENSGGEFTAVL